MGKPIRPARRRWPQVYLPLWVLLVVAFFTWQSGSYIGIIALLAEWQFNEFGVYHPLLTLVLILAVLVPLPLLLTLRRKRETGNRAETAANANATADSEADTLGRAIASATRFLNFLVVASIGCFVAALIAVVMMLALPGAGGDPQRITASVDAPAIPREGTTEISGRILYNRTSAFDEYLWLWGRNVRFAPIVEGSADETTVRYFVELAPTDGATPPSTDVRRGILKRNGLPGEILRLYRYAGFDVAEPHYVLFSSVEVMRWPYIVWAVEFALAGLAIGIGALVQLLRKNRLGRSPDPQQG